MPSFVTLSKRLSHRSGVFDRRSVCIHDDAHQICNGAGIGFIHNGSTVGFNGLNRNTQVSGDLFIQTAAHNSFKNVLLYGSQFDQKSVVQGALFSLGFTLTGFLQHSFD